MRARLFSACLLLAATLPLLAADKGEGTLTANGKTAKLTHVYATSRVNHFDKTKTDTFVIAIDKELAPEALFDDFELMRVTDGANGFSAQIDPDGSITSGQIFSPNFTKMNSFSAVGSQKAELTTRTKERIAGKIYLPKPDDFFGNTFQYSATFDVPLMQKPAPVARKGTPLPAGGGDPAKAYVAYRKAMKSGDLAALKKLIVPEMTAQMDDPDFKKMFPMMQAMQAKSITITGGVVDGSTATLDVKDNDDKNSLGTVTMVKMGNVWVLKQESWKSTTE
jgi:hypothetical protein